MDATDAVPLDPDDQPPRPRMLECPVYNCDANIVLDGETDMAAAAAWVAEHEESHTKRDYLDTIGLLVERINELQSALRGAALMKMAETEASLEQPSNLLVPKEHRHGDTRIIDGKPATLVGKRLPDHIAESLGLKPRGKKGRKR